MQADFMRVMFRKTKRGTFVSVSANDEIRGSRLHLAYIGAGAVPMEEDTYPLDILVVGDAQDETLELLKEMVQKRDIHTVVLPEDAGGAAAFCLEHGVKEVCEVDTSLEIKKERWELLFRSLPGADGKTLVLYQRFTGCDISREDCVLTGKTIHQEPCVPCIYGDDDYCGFGCMRNRDFDMLKGHKRPGSACYRMGTLILGSVSLKEQAEELMGLMKGCQDELRCICLPWGLTEENFDDGLLADMPDEDYVYLIGHSSQAVPGALRTLMEHKPCLQYRTVSEEYGFCISGYRIPYLKKEEKGC